MDQAERLAAADDVEAEADARLTAVRLAASIRRLKPADRQVILLYLEDFTARQIAEVTGLKAGAVAVRIHRIKALLLEQFTRKDMA